MKFAELPTVLRANRRNWVQAAGADGRIRRHPFAEVDAEARNVAAGLLARLRPVAPPDRVVAISGPTGLSWLVTAVACVYLGVEIVAVPESSPWAEQQRLAKARHASLFVDVEGPAREGGDSAVPVVAAADLRADGRDMSFEQAGFQVIAYTSGSSSAAVKAFRVVGDATENFIENFVRLYRMSAADSWVICHSFSHIVHLEYALGGLCHGYNVTLTSPTRVMLGKVEDTPAALVSVPSVYQGMADRMRKKLPTTGPRAWLLNRWLDAPVTALTRLAAPWVRRILAPDAVSPNWTKLKVAIIGAAPSGPDLQRFLILMGMPMYEGYGMSETQMLTANVPGRCRFGTVGPVWPGVDLRLSERNELEARLARPRTSGYLDEPEATAATFGADGWVRTGDIAEVRDGYFAIVGRIKSTIVLSHGKNVNPEAIERKLDDIANVRASLVTGDRRPHLVALLVVRSGLSEAESAAVQAGVLEVNSLLPRHERIGDYLCLDESADITDEFFTRSGKVRRAAVNTKFASRIDALYARQER